MNAQRVWPCCLLLVACFAHVDGDSHDSPDAPSEGGTAPPSHATHTTPQSTRTRSDFCRAWSAAACNSEVVSVCQAKDATACRQAQEAFCTDLVPDDFSSAGSDACIAAVAAAYRDADLRDNELAVVLRLGGACARLVSKPHDLGEDCSEPSDCDSSIGHACVKKADSPTGKCQVPELVNGGRDCKAVQKACATGFFCDGRNCIETLDAGEQCTIAEQCSEGDYCDDGGHCAALRAVSDHCESDAQCRSGICLEFEGENVCIDRIVLTRAEPICANLR